LNSKDTIPKVSVVVPVYNSAKYLRQALDSIVNQTLKEIEIIVVNDGSTDESLNIIKEYVSKDCRIILIDQPNGGVANAINNGIAMARGEYLAEMDSDDYIKPEMYEELYGHAKTNDLDIAISNYYEFTGNTEDFEAVPRRFFDTPEWYNKVFDPQEFYRDKFSGDHLKGFGQCVCAIWTSLYKREFLTENSICWNEKVRAYNDNGFWYQTRTLAKKIMYIDKAYFFHRRDNTGSTTNNFEKFEQDLFGEQDHVKNFLIEKNLWDGVKDLYVKRIFQDYLYFALPNLSPGKIKQFTAKISSILSDFVRQNGDIAHNALTENERRIFSIITENPSTFARMYIAAQQKTAQQKK